MPFIIYDESLCFCFIITIFKKIILFLSPAVRLYCKGSELDDEKSLPDYRMMMAIYLLRDWGWKRTKLEPSNVMTQ